MSPFDGLELLQQQADAGGLAAAGRADEEDELAAADAHRRAVEADGAAVIDLRDVLELDYGRGRLRRWAPTRRDLCGPRRHGSGWIADLLPPLAGCKRYCREKRAKRWRRSPSARPASSPPARAGRPSPSWVRRARPRASGRCSGRARRPPRRAGARRSASARPRTAPSARRARAGSRAAAVCRRRRR